MSQSNGISSDYLYKYGKSELLTEEREQEINRILSNGNEEERQKAKDTLFQSNIGLVYYWAERMTCPLDIYDDLLQEGMIGLHNAIQKYSPDYKVKFTTHASYWIRATMRRYLYTTLYSGYSEPDAILLEKIKAIEDKFISDDKTYTLQDIKDKLPNVSATTFNNIIYSRYSVKPFSVYEQDSSLDDSDTDISDWLLADKHDMTKEVAKEMLLKQLTHFIDTLDNKQNSFILKKYFYDNWTAAQIGRALNRTRQDINLRLHSQLKKLSKSPECKLIYHQLLELS